MGLAGAGGAGLGQGGGLPAQHEAVEALHHAAEAVEDEHEELAQRGFGGGRGAELGADCGHDSPERLGQSGGGGDEYS